MPFVPDSSDDGGASTMFADTPVAYNDKGHAYVPPEVQRSRDERATRVKAIPDPEDNPVERNAADEKSAIQQANRLKPGAEGRADVLKAAEEAHQRASGTGLTKGRFVPDEQQPADEQEPLQGADAIPGSQADRARQGLAVLDSNEDGPTVTPTPTMGQHVADTVNAAMHAVTSAAGGILGSFTGIGQHLGEVAGEAVTRIDRAARGVPVRLPTDGPLPTLEQAQSDQAGAITGQLNKALPEMTEGAQDITDKYIQPVMDNLAAIAPLHGTLGPSGQLSLAGKVAKAGATTGADLARQASVGVAKQLIGVDPELAKIAQTASELKYPIDVRPDQVKEGAKFSKLTGQAASDMPFSNSKNKSNQRAFTKNLIDLLNPESTADRLTPDTFAKAMTRSGEGIGDIAARTPVPLDDPLRADLTAQAHDALTVGTNEADRVVVNFVKQAFEKAEIGSGVIDGTALRELNSKIGQVARSNAGNDLGRRLNILQDSLQGAVERNASPADVPALREFRRQYAYGKTVEPLVGNPAASLNGLISPAQLSARVTATKAGKHYMAMAMGGPLGDLARVGQLVKEPISSGTAERSLVYGLVKDAGKTLAGVAGGVPAALAYNTLGPRLVRALTRRPEGFERPPFNPEVERNLRANWESDSPTPPVEPTTSPGAGPGIPPVVPPASPLGDTTPDWQTAPGAGPTIPGGGDGPPRTDPNLGPFQSAPQRWGGGTDIPAVEGTPATAAEAPVAGPANEQPAPRGAASDIPAVPGRPDLPDTVVSGPPSGSEHFTDPKTQAELNTPGAQEAMRRISTPPPKIPVGETNSLTPAEEAKWRKQFSLSTPDAARAKDVAAAYAIDPHATELAAQLYDNLPAKFDAEIAKIKARGEANANQGNEAAAGSESAGARPGGDGSAAVPAGGGDSAGSEPVRATEKPGSGAGGPDAAGTSEPTTPGVNDGNVRREANPQDNPEGQAQDRAQPQGGQETQEGPPEAEDSLRVGAADPGAKILGTHEAVRQALHERFGQKFIQGLEDAGLLRFATRAEDGNIPARGAMREKGRNGANRPEGTLYVDTLTKDSAPQVLMHELGAHFGIVRLLGEERYRLMLKGLREDLRNDPEVKAAWVDVTRRYTGEKSATKYKVGDKNFMHEVAAQLVEKHPDMPFVRRMINEVRAYFYEKFGPTRFNTLDADLVRGLAASALRKTTKGAIDRAQTPVDFRKAGPQKVSAPKPADPHWSPTDRMRAVKTAREIDTKAVDNAAREHDVGMEFDRAVQRIIASRKP